MRLTTVRPCPKLNIANTAACQQAASEGESQHSCWRLSLGAALKRESGTPRVQPSSPQTSTSPPPPRGVARPLWPPCRWHPPPSPMAASHPSRTHGSPIQGPWPPPHGLSGWGAPAAPRSAAGLRHPPGLPPALLFPPANLGQAGTPCRPAPPRPLRTTSTIAKGSSCPDGLPMQLIAPSLSLRARSLGSEVGWCQQHAAAATAMVQTLLRPPWCKAACSLLHVPPYPLSCVIATGHRLNSLD